MATDQKPFLPVIVVPGITASTLRDEYPVAPETVWSVLRMVAKQFERIALHPSDPRYELQEPARVRADGLFDLIYGEFIEEARHNLAMSADEPVPVFPFAYDWRQPLKDTVEQFRIFVDEVIDRTRLLRHYHKAGYGSPSFPAQVNLVAHSMGGLIVAGYLIRNGDAKVQKVATIATPFRGSLEAVAKVAVGIAALGLSPGASRERESARLTPALYHLLPSFENDVVGPLNMETDLFKVEAWQEGVLQTLAQFITEHGVIEGDPEVLAFDLFDGMLKQALQYRSEIENLALTNPKRWLCIAGVDQPTRVQMKIFKDAKGKVRFDLSDKDVENAWGDGDTKRHVLTGDSTVPYLGSQCSFIPTEQMVCVRPCDFGFWEIKDRILESFGLHAALPNMNLVQRLVVSHFKGKPEGDIWGWPPPDLPAGKAWDPPIAGLVDKSVS